MAEPKKPKKPRRMPDPGDLPDGKPPKIIAGTGGEMAGDSGDNREMPGQEPPTMANGSDIH